jgi:hypothetical protein
VCLSRLLYPQSVRFIGPTKFSSDVWVGVCLDLPVGKNDGSVDGVRYFYCPKASGVFVRPHTVTLDGPTQPLSPTDSHATFYDSVPEGGADGPGSASNGGLVRWPTAGPTTSVRGPRLGVQLPRQPCRALPGCIPAPPKEHPCVSPPWLLERVVAPGRVWGADDTRCGERLL